MGNPIAEMLDKAAKMDRNRQAQIEAQKASIDRLLDARNSGVEDAELIRDLCDEHRTLIAEKLLLQARIKKVESLLDAEEGATVLSYDLVKEALDG